MSLLDKASLVVTPNAIKEDKLYSIIPTDGSGDLNVVRATTATRVNSDGLIEQVPYNLLQRSEEFDNAYWSKLNITITPNNALSPSGTLTADLVTPTSTGLLRRIYGTLSSGTYTATIYLKSNTGSSFTTRLVFRDSVNNITETKDITVSTNWERFFITFTTAGTTGFEFWIGGSGTLDVGKNLFIWGAQLVTGTEPKEYFPTTDRLNVPRLDYTNGSCPSILVEPQRTNIAKYSEDFNEGVWEKGTAITLVSNTTETTSPQGINNATKATANGTGLIFIRQNVFAATTLPTTNSIFVKKANNRYVGFRNGGGGVLHDVFDFDTETWTNNSGSTLSFDKLVNGWYRLKSSRTNTSSNFYISITIPSNTSGGESVTVSNLNLYLWGGQSELNVLNATSYIPTIASSVTRNADVISKTGISDLIGQTEGTFYFNGNVFFNDATSRQISLSDGSSSTNKISLIYTPTSNQLQAFIRASGSISFNVSVILASAINETKIAIKYKQNDFALWVNGVEVSTDTSGNVPSLLNKLSFDDADGTNRFQGNVKSVQLYKEALTDEELILLTGDSFDTYNEMANALIYTIQ